MGGARLQHGRGRGCLPRVAALGGRHRLSLHRRTSLPPRSSPTSVPRTRKFPPVTLNLAPVVQCPATAPPPTRGGRRASHANAALPVALIAKSGGARRQKRRSGLCQPAGEGVDDAGGVGATLDLQG